MQNVQDIFETRKLSFISAGSVSATVPLKVLNFAIFAIFGHFRET